MWVSIVLGVSHRRSLMPRSVSPWASSARTSRSRVVSSSRRLVVAGRRRSRFDEFWVDDRLAAADAVDCVGEDRDVGDAILEQVAAMRRDGP